jgi:hypothetical protein
VRGDGVFHVSVGPDALGWSFGGLFSGRFA